MTAVYRERDFWPLGAHWKPMPLAAWGSASRGGQDQMLQPPAYLQTLQKLNWPSVWWLPFFSGSPPCKIGLVLPDAGGLSPSSLPSSLGHLCPCVLKMPSPWTVNPHWPQWQVTFVGCHAYPHYAGHWGLENEDWTSQDKPHQGGGYWQEAVVTACDL